MNISIILMGVAIVLLGSIVLYLAKKVYELNKSFVSLAVIVQAKTDFMHDNPMDIVKKVIGHVDET